MGEVPKNLKSSVPVPSVQELVIQGLNVVPSIYIRNDVEDTLDSFTSSDVLGVPLIDMTKLVNPDLRSVELQKLHSACKDWGIFQLINHGVSNEMLANMGEQGREFFALPSQVKKQWAQKPGSLQGYGQAFVTSEDQKLDWNDMIFLEVLPSQNRKLEFWPQSPKKFGKTMETYTEGIRQVAVSLIGFMAMGLEVEAQGLCDAYRNGQYDVRVTYYPPCPVPERVVGFSPHADMSGITLLIDCGDTPGLQVLRNGQWVLVKPQLGAIVVFVGQITEVISNGIYNAPDHMAVVNKLKERISIATFCYPDSSVKIGPAKELIERGSTPHYKTLTREEYFDCFFNRKLEVSFIACLKI